MAEDLITILTKFHREIVVPDMQQMFADLRGEMNERFSEVYGHFDAIYQRLDRLETEYQMFSSA